jgi:hypothetical protein
LEKSPKPDQPQAAAPPPRKEEREGGWVSNVPPAKDGKSGGAPAKFSLDDLFLFDPNFESCW